MRQTVLAMLIIVTAVAAALGADGFGSKTTGGKGGKTVTVTDARALQEYTDYSDTPYIIEIQGTIDLSPVGGYLDLRSNKTLRGVGEKPTIIGELGFKSASTNVIFENLNITNPKGAGGGDGISIKEHIQDVIVTHCTFFDCEDGCLDITRGSDWITVSWCKFYFTEPNSHKSRICLIGNSDNAADDDEGKLHITMHHNWFGPLCWQRIPSVRFAKLHLYNNYYNCKNNLYCLRSRIKAQCLVENNFYEGVRDPYLVYTKKELPEDAGRISAHGNIFKDCINDIVISDDEVFKPSYEYKLAETEKVKEMVTNKAGAKGEK